MTQSELELKSLVDRIKANDLTAFDEIYRLTRDEVARLLFHLVGDRDDLEALVSETYSRLLDAAREMGEQDLLRPVIHALCAKVALRHLGFWGKKSAVAAALPGEPADENDAARLLHGALAQLPPKTRVAFVYSELLGLSPDEVAKTMGASRRAVGSHLRRARHDLTHAMRQQDLEVAP